ncbi:MAG: transglycosylase domain-containing protein, partial [Gammaproteobacteria bacterium]|nr:transglycosylase domain-containing protein [Gammaproteobacteria bacterium]
MSNQVDPNQVLKTWFYRSVKLMVFVAIITTFYLIYLDAWVQQKMSGPKWQTPIKVYARPLQLYPHLYLNPQELISELKLLNYRKSTSVREPGQYKQNDEMVTFYRREFVYVDGAVLPQKVRVSFENNRVTDVETYSQNQWNQEAISMLEPLLISRESDDNNEHREIINLATVPEWMIDTLITVEDKNFYHHNGISPFAIARALLANIRAGRKVQGGSTLTQQLAKNLLLNDSRKSYIRKIKEAFIALILDYRFSKDAILEAYFNEIYLGQNGNNGVHGFALASKFYFDKPLAELERHEFALLVAMVKGPSYYNPLRQQKRALARRDLVLQLMVSDNVIDNKEYEYFIQQPMQVVNKVGQGKSRFPSYMQLVMRELKALQLPEQHEANGLLVFTGLDPVLQKNYEKLFNRSIKQLEKQHKLQDINGAVISLSLDNASISALVGDKHANSFGFNRALDANRNIGSLIKPAVYLTALA